MARSAAPAGASRGGGRVDNIEVVVAGSAETMGASPWEEVVLAVTKALVKRKLADEPGWGLGGTWSYATNFSNDTFIIHRFCWCERDDCPYCSGCDCPEEAFTYKVDGKPCTWEESKAFFDAHVPDMKTTPYEEWQKAADKVNDRRDWCKNNDLECGYCRGTKWAEYGNVAGWGVPLFWHKPSGVRMTWYKYLGRGTHVYIPDGVQITPNEVLQSCLESLANTKDGG